jgi:thiamine transport system substrate-binding protein
MEETMRPTVTRFPALAAGLLIAAPGLAETPTLTILAYDSVARYLGPALAEEFEPRCSCRLDFVALGGSAELVPRLAAEAERHRADLVLGIETNNAARAAATGLLVPHGVDAEAPDLPVRFDDPLFLPYAWSHLAFIYDADRLEGRPPASFAELAESDLTVVIQNPHTSTTGLGLVMWIEAAFGDRAEAVWESLAPRIHRVVPTWSDAYHPIFREGQVDMVLSYATSPGWHRAEEDDDGPRTALFEEGHYVRIEVAALLADAPEPDLARNFLAFLLAPEAQALIPEIRVMYPAAIPEAGLPEAYAGLPLPESTLFLGPEEAEARREPALAAWRAATGR